MRKFIAVTVATAAFSAVGASGAVAASNPSGTGPPSQSCQSLNTYPGNASNSPGSPFNEPSGSNPGGTGGLHYSQNSQYDVACYQQSQRP